MLYHNHQKTSLSIEVQCKACSTIFYTVKSKQERVKYCSKACKFQGIPLEERFWKKVDKTSTCWLWTGAKVNNGYGVVANKYSNIRAHVYSYELENKVKVPKGMLICHKCDVPSCVNPDHLFMGTSQDNSDDMIKKGRKAVGVATNRAKLTPSSVRSMRKMVSKGMSDISISKVFNVSSGTVWQVKNNNVWKHVT